MLSDHKLKKVVQARKRSLDKAIEGLGQHGLVGTSDETLTNLHDALKVQPNLKLNRNHGFPICICEKKNKLN